MIHIRVHIRCQFVLSVDSEAIQQTSSTKTIDLRLFKKFTLAVQLEDVSGEVMRFSQTLRRLDCKLSVGYN